MKRALILLAPGFEEVEALTVTDILRRGGVETTLTGTVDSPHSRPKRNNCFGKHLLSVASKITMPLYCPGEQKGQRT